MTTVQVASNYILWVLAKTKFKTDNRQPTDNIPQAPGTFPDGLPVFPGHPMGLQDDIWDPHRQAGFDDDQVGPLYDDRFGPGFIGDNGQFDDPFDDRDQFDDRFDDRDQFDDRGQFDDRFGDQPPFEKEVFDDQFIDDGPRRRSYDEEISPDEERRGSLEEDRWSSDERRDRDEERFEDSPGPENVTDEESPREAFSEEDRIDEDRSSLEGSLTDEDQGRGRESTPTATSSESVQS